MGLKTEDAGKMGFKNTWCVGGCAEAWEAAEVLRTTDELNCWCLEDDNLLVAKYNSIPVSIEANKHPNHLVNILQVDTRRTSEHVG